MNQTEYPKFQNSWNVSETINKEHRQMSISKGSNRHKMFEESNDFDEFIFEMKKKNREYLDRIPKANVIVMIDETNSPGSRKDGKQYVLGATAVDVDKLDEFNDITEKRYKGRELKFRKQPRHRKNVLKEMSELDTRTYAVTVEIPPDELKWDEGEQADVHQEALATLMDRISVKEKVQSIHMIIDENNKAKQGKVDEILSEANRKSKKTITADIKRSEETFSLQTNDFAVGAMGKKYNHNDGEYLKMIPGHDRTVMVFERKAKQNKKDKKQ